MADEVFRRMLLKLGIPMGEFNSAVREIRSKLQQIHEEAKRNASEMKAEQKKQLDLTRTQIADQKRLQAESKTLLSLDQAKAAWEKKNQEALKTKIQQRILETAELKKQQIEQAASVRMEQEQLRLSQQRLRLSIQQTKEQERQVKQQAGASGGGVFGVLGRGLAGALGGGPIGMIAAGAGIGTAVEQAFSGLIDKVKGFVHALEEATGAEAQLEEQFIKLSKRAGTDPSDFVAKLRVATRGLVDDMQLFRVANNFMQSGVKASSSQIVRLTELTVALARAQGKDATQAMNALVRASLTGRTMGLAMATGLDRQTLALKGMSQYMDSNTRKTMEFNKVLTEMEKRYAAVGTPATTFVELMKQIDVAEKEFVTDTALAMAKTLGFNNTIQGLSQILINIRPMLTEIAETIGTKIGDVFNVFISGYHAAHSLAVAFYEMYEAVKVVVKPIGQLFDILTGAGKEEATWNKAIGGLAMMFDHLAYSVENAVIRIKGVGAIAKSVLEGNYYDVMTKYDEMNKELNKSTLRYSERLLKDANIMAGKSNIDIGAAGPTQTSDNITAAKAAQKLELEITKETIQIKFELQMQALKKLERETKQAYEAGAISLAQEVAKERDIYEQEHAAKLKQIEDERKAEIQQIQQKGVESGTPAGIIAKQEQAQNLKSKLAIEKENESHAEKMDALNNKLLADQQAAYRAHVENLNKIANDAVKERISILETEFKQGTVDADTYLTERKKLYLDEYNTTIQGLNRRMEAEKNNAKEIEKLEASKVQAYIDYQKQITRVSLTEDEIRFKSEQNQYDRVMKLLEVKAAMYKKSPMGGSVQEGLINEDQLKVLDQHLRNMEAQQQRMIDEGHTYGDVWEEIAIKIAKARAEQQRLLEQQAQLKSTAAPLGTLFGQIGSVVGAAGGGPRSQAISQLLSSIDQSLKHIAAFQVGIGQAGGAKSYFTQLGKMFEDLFKSKVHVKTRDPITGKETDEIKKVPLAEKLQDFVKALGTAISGIMGLVQGVTSGKSASGGVLSGGMAGLQFGAKFGPLGMLAGGIGGAVMGGIFGSKQAALERDIKKIQNQMQSIVDSMNAGTISMGQAIADLRKERESAIKMLSGDKKGGKSKKGAMSQAQTTIAAIDQEIMKLVDEQKQILDQLHTSLVELSQPVAFQEYLSSLDQIIEKYKQFASAASGNTEEVAAANQWLNLSLQQYVTTLSQQLNQAQQDAINNALTLINLEHEKQQIINQEAQQEYDILTQGVLTRQRTTAMTKGQQIGELRYQRDMQLQQINEQIELAKYKVEQESKIFDLASDRIGLENQLLAAQKSQADVQIAQILALSQVVSGLQSGLSSGQIMQQISGMFAGGAMPTGTGLMAILASLLGLNVPSIATSGQYGSTNWLASVPQPYQSAANYVASVNPNFVDDIKAAMTSAPGSTARKTAESDVKTLASQGKAEGYDMTGLMSWISTAAAMPSMQKGGIVEETGPIYAHEGEGVLPKPMMQMINTISTLGQSSASTDLSDLQLQTHKNLIDMTSTRTDMEMNVISARYDQIDMEMSYLKSLNQTLDRMQQTTGSGSGQSTSFSGMLQKEYEVRGRYGSANFRRETL